MRAALLALLVLLVLLVLLPAACGSGLSQRSGDPDRIEPTEIAASDAQNALELVQRLRPRWLQQRTDRSTRLETVILVYMDGARLGGLDQLRDITLPMIHSLRALDAAEAGTLPGLGSQHVERVIMIHTHPR